MPPLLPPRPGAQGAPQLPGPEPGPGLPSLCPGHHQCCVAQIRAACSRAQACVDASQWRAPWLTAVRRRQKLLVPPAAALRAPAGGYLVPVKGGRPVSCCSGKVCGQALLEHAAALLVSCRLHGCHSTRVHVCKFQCPRCARHWKCEVGHPTSPTRPRLAGLSGLDERKSLGRRR